LESVDTIVLRISNFGSFAYLVFFSLLPNSFSCIHTTSYREQPLLFFQCNQLDPTLGIAIAEDTLFLSSPSKETKFTPMAEALPATVTKIKAENPDVNIIIAVGHAGNAVDLKVCAVVLHGCNLCVYLLMDEKTWDGPFSFSIVLFWTVPIVLTAALWSVAACGSQPGHRHYCRYAAVSHPLQPPTPNPPKKRKKERK
jgi:hypothetical protein